MTPCPACGGFLVREPATVTCTACGRFGIVLDASDAERLAQRVLDWILRPRSVECWPEYQGLIPPPARPGSGWVALPGAPRAKRRKRREPAPGPAGAATQRVSNG